MVELHDTASSSRAGHTVLAGDARSHTFKNLNPGTRYSVAVRATAGPYHTSTPNLTHCTREYDALLAARCPPPDLLPSQFKSEAILVQTDPAFLSHPHNPHGLATHTQVAIHMQP